MAFVKWLVAQTFPDRATGRGPTKRADYPDSVWTMFSLDGFGEDCRQTIFQTESEKSSARPIRRRP